MAETEKAAPSSAAQEKPRRNTVSITERLAVAVAESEELERQGRYREAAELTALAMAEAHSQYVQARKGLHPPVMPKPSQDYVERYKARLRVDWSKWDRLSHGNGRGGGAAGAAVVDDDGEDEESEADSSASPFETHKSWQSSAAEPLDSGKGPMREEVWQPDTLSKSWQPGSEVSTSDTGPRGDVEIVHRCGDGKKVTMLVSSPELPRKAAQAFNKDPKRTMAALRKGPHEGGPDFLDRAYTCEELAMWFLTAEQLSKNKIGEYLGRNDENAVNTMHAFLALLDFGELVFDEALRFFLSLFRLPGEAQQIDRVMQNFADRYTEAHPTTFASADTAYILAFSLIMLNTDAHSDAIPNKMTLEQFLSNNRGIGENGSDLPDELLTALYNSIHANEIIIEQREYIKSVREGWLSKQGGRVKSWKKRYVILSGNVLYYFKSPKDKAPAGFLPLENIEVRPYPDKLTFELLPAAGHASIKSVRMATDKKHAGGFEQGHHKSFMFKAGSAEDLDLWVKAVRQFTVEDLARAATIRQPEQSIKSKKDASSKVSGCDRE